MLLHKFNNAKTKEKIVKTNLGEPKGSMYRIMKLDLQ